MYETKIKLAICFLFVIGSVSMFIGCNSQSMGSEIKGVTIIKSDQAIQTSPADENQMKEIIKLSSDNTMLGVFKRISEEEVDNQFKIAELRQIRNVKGENIYYENLYYNVFENESGKLFVFYDDDLHLDLAIFSGSKLSFTSFDSLEVDKSTFEDVKAIDPSIGFSDTGAFIPTKYVNEQLQFYKFYSIHMAAEGVVSIGYRKSGDTLYVETINKIEDPRIKSIHSKDSESSSQKVSHENLQGNFR